MIGYLEGKIVHVSASDVTVAAGGVGYRAAIPSRLSLSKGDEVALYVYTRVKEDSITLFGFETVEERDVFEIVIGAQGVGPSTAMSMLNVFSGSELARAVEDHDVEMLVQVPGIGKKTAERVLLDLQGKFKNVEPASESNTASKMKREARQALQGLGYQPVEIDRALREASDSEDVGSLIQSCLKVLADRRKT